MLQEATVLIAEANVEDALLLGLAFICSGIACQLRFVGDSSTAVRYLLGKGPNANRAEFPLPHLLVLDVTTPEMQGFKILRWVRHREELRHLPVIVFTWSPFSPQISRAYQLGANSFLTKPQNFKDFAVAVGEVASFWLSANQQWARAA